MPTPIPLPAWPRLPFLDGLEAPTPCAGRWELFDTATPEHQDEAARLCARCPVRDACAAHAGSTREPAGIWAGLTPRDRRVPDLDDDAHPRAECGTEGAWRQHVRRREQCQPCQAAHEHRLAADRRARLDAIHASPAGGSGWGVHLHRLLGERACRRCRDAQNAMVSRARRRAKATGEQEPAPALGLAS
ncbi:hypothetical protein AQ490_23280 [Wenjunlia vitaminophila]|uniref:4Fe-4S Wbl-type domain-containing protein n=1 Tax=Wenjunlia vitaminophila TaxID=76728 RepID=A0A0T6LSM6_WENVI|nr:WhiB family transcriptional regulator [Wenjunlia vitaminophila]KRV48796.1 hypothetical protein AQ490_23280 [Wenjunlia vitaminophila]